MAAFETLMGDFEATKESRVAFGSVNLSPKGTKSVWKQVKYPLADIKIIELIDSETERTIGRTLGWAVAGAVVAGPLGLIAGFAGKRSEVRFACQFKDGKRFLGAMSPRAFRKLTKPMVLDGRFDPDAKGSRILKELAEQPNRTHAMDCSLAADVPNAEVQKGEVEVNRDANGTLGSTANGRPARRISQILGLALGLPIVASLIVNLDPSAGLIFVLAVVVAAGIAVFRPLPRLGLGSRPFNAFLVVWVGIVGLGLVGARDPSAVERNEPAALLTSDSATSLAAGEVAAVAAERQMDPVERRELHERLAARVMSLIDQREWSQAQGQFQVLADRDPEDIAALRAEAEARALALVRPIPAADIEGNLAGYRLLAALMPDNSTYIERVVHYSERERAPAPLAPQRARQAPAEVVAQTEELLYNWQPKSITLSGSILRVVLPQRRITPEIYSAVIRLGVCFGPLLGHPLPGVRSVEVLNEFAHQGFVYEAGTEDCEQINAAPPDRAEILLLGKTHTF
ncbi:MAG: hypothetical protein ACK41U_00105 [Paracoccus sp. (in: a-proteobacteria)]|uniref:hypothetical protein n=1 Tax=Paracoccus sp. TaxID=267 RepID=UPI00391A00CA